MRSKQRLYSAKDCGPLVFWATLAAFVLIYGWMAWAGNRAFMRILFDTDVGMFHSVMKHALRGEVPRYYNLYAGTWTHYFATDHFNPEIFLILPLWALMPGNVVFAWVQIVVYAATASLLFAIARIRLGSQSWAFVIAAAFLLSPRPGYSLYNHFTSAPFVILFLTWAVWALLRTKHGWYWVALAGLLLAREDAAILGVAVGVYAWLALGHGRQGAITIGVSTVYLAAMIWVVLPLLGGGVPYPYIAGGYGWLGRTLTEALWRLVSDPVELVQRIDSMGGIRGLTMHLLPFGFTPLASWRGVILLAPVSYLLLHPHASSLDYHYSYEAAILAGLAAVEGVRQFRVSFLPRLRGRGGEVVLGGGLLVLAMGAHVWDGYSPISRHFKGREFISGPRERAMRKAVALVPLGSRVSASRVYMTYLIATRDLECTWDRVEVRDDAGPLGLRCEDTKAPVRSEYLLLTDEAAETEEFRRVAERGLYAQIFSREGTLVFRQRTPIGASP